jgi:inner membrane protein
MATSFAESLGRFTRSPGFKFFLVAGLVLLLSIPLALVWFLVTEREGRFHGVKTELAQLFGAEQSLTGPFLIVPYTVRVTRVLNDKSIEDTEERYAVFLPDEFKVDGSANTEIRHRSIYDVTLYTAKLKLSGRFPAPDMRLVDPEAANIRWRDAILSLALSDVSGLKEAATLTLDGNRTVAFEPSVGLPNNSTSGLNVRLFPIDAPTDQPPAAFTFATDIVFNGSSLLQIAPIGRETQVVLASDWPHPSFTGAFLPETRDIRNDGFTASWRIPHLARSVPQAWRVSASQSSGIHQAMWQSLSGVNFYVPIDYYDLVNRAAKYGLLFLAVGFFGVLVLELTSGRRFHAVQYVFVGLAMILFYILLLGLSEHIGFTTAYLVASGATGGMVSLYIGKSLQSALRGLMMLSIFLILYGLLYLILRLEDYALLAGAVASFLMLTVVMFATLRVNWSGEGGAVGARQLAE